MGRLLKTLMMQEDISNIDRTEFSKIVPSISRAENENFIHIRSGTDFLAIC